MQLTVWCDPADTNAWDDFVVDRDVPDYYKRFAGEKEVMGKNQERSSDDEKDSLK